MEIILKRNDYINYRGYYDTRNKAYIINKSKEEINTVIEKAIAESTILLYQIQGSFLYTKSIGKVINVDGECVIVDIYDEDTAKRLQRFNTRIKFMFGYEGDIGPECKLWLILAYIE